MSTESRPADHAARYLAFDRLVPADVSMIAALRADLASWLDGHGIAGDDRDAVVLACSEALANAIEHGYRDDPLGIVAVTGRLTGTALEITVRDSGAWIPMRRHPDRGRGLVMIEKLMDRSEVTTGNGTTVSMQRQVTFEVALGS